MERHRLASIVVNYLRKIVFVHVYKNENNEPVYFVDNKYWAVMEGEKSGAGKLVDGEIIHCKVNSFNKRGFFSISRVNTGIANAKMISSEPPLDKMTYSQLIRK